LSASLIVGNDALALDQMVKEADGENGCYQESKHNQKADLQSGLAAILFLDFGREHS
jgi:hypothetical protein